MIVLDTTTLVYAVGTDHSLAEPSRRLIEAVGTGRISATTTVEAIQEFAHVRARRRDRRDAARLALSYATLLAPLLVVGESELAQGLELFKGHPRLGAFDAVLSATALSRGADALVSADSAFADVAGLPFVGLPSPELEAVLEE